MNWIFSLGLTLTRSNCSLSPPTPCDIVSIGVFIPIVILLRHALTTCPEPFWAFFSRILIAALIRCCARFPVSRPLLCATKSPSLRCCWHHPPPRSGPPTPHPMGPPSSHQRRPRYRAAAAAVAAQGHRRRERLLRVRPLPSVMSDSGIQGVTPNVP